MTIKLDIVTCSKCNDTTMIVRGDKVCPMCNAENSLTSIELQGIDQSKAHDRWQKERETDPVRGVQIAKTLFEMDVEATVYRIRDGRIKHTLAELRGMTAYQQLQAGAVGLHDRASESDPDECCTFAVYTVDDRGFHNLVEDYPTTPTAFLQAAFLHAENLAAHHAVAIDDQSQTEHHVIVTTDDRLLDRAFNLMDAEKSLAYYVSNGEDAYLANSKDFLSLRVSGWRATL